MLAHVTSSTRATIAASARSASEKRARNPENPRAKGVTTSERAMVDVPSRGSGRPSAIRRKPCALAVCSIAAACVCCARSTRAMMFSHEIMS
jgi:hypothetical protein